MKMEMRKVEENGRKKRKKTVVKGQKKKINE